MKHLVLLVAAFGLGGLVTGCDEDVLSDPVKIDRASEWPQPKGMDDWQQIVPGPGLPDEVETMKSTNNLDIILFEDRLWLSFRTGPTHFASTEVTMYLVSSDDLTGRGEWRFEKKIATGKDIREPRFFELGGELFFYYSQLGTNTLAFEPGEVFAIKLLDDGTWTDPLTVFDDGTIVWRTKTRPDAQSGSPRVYMTAYRGGENIYQEFDSGEKLELLFLTSNNGIEWQGVDIDKPVVMYSGISEVGFEFDAERNLIAVGRNETGDETGFGSRVCSAKADSLGDWTCTTKSDPHKYDSPFMFRYKDKFYLIARYNPERDYDLTPEDGNTGPGDWLHNEIVYSTSPKRTALYGVDPETMEVIHLHTFPSSGDTAFASGAWIDAHRMVVVNYSSPPEHPDTTWIDGQLNGSQLYAAVLDFSGQ